MMREFHTLIDKKKTLINVLNVYRSASKHWLVALTAIEMNDQYILHSVNIVLNE